MYSYTVIQMQAVKSFNEIYIFMVWVIYLKLLLSLMLQRSSYCCFFLFFCFLSFVLLLEHI